MPITLEQFAAGLEAISLAYPRTARLTDSQRDLWWSQLCDLEADEWKRAVSTAIREGDDWPTIAKLRRYGRGGIDVEDRAALAWGELRQSARSLGGHCSVEFADPVIAATVRAVFGGWVELCDLPSNQVDKAQGPFERTYARLCRSGITRQQAGPFVGWLDQDAARQPGDVRRIETAGEPHEGLRITGPEPKRIASDAAPDAVRKLAKATSIVEHLEDLKAKADEQRAIDIEAITIKEREQKAAAVVSFREAVGK